MSVKGEENTQKNSKSWLARVVEIVIIISLVFSNYIGVGFWMQLNTNIFHGTISPKPVGRKYDIPISLVVKFTGFWLFVTTDKDLQMSVGMNGLMAFWSVGETRYVMMVTHPRINQSKQGLTMKIMQFLIFSHELYVAIVQLKYSK